MEKPSPSYDISSRFALHTREDSEKNERYYDRMAIRGIPVLRDGDEERAAPVWRGDHSFSSDAATYSLMHFIEPEVAREHPDWTPTQIHEQAVEHFEKRLAQDLVYEHREIVHEESVVRWQPVKTSDGKVELATEYGDKLVTLSELWEHTKEYAAFAGNPAAYNSEEHQAQLLMQDKLMNGSSSGFVSVLSHPDAVRYVQVWQKSDNGDVISHHVDLFAATGKDFSPQEAKELVYHLSDFHSERTESGLPDTDLSYAHFFITQGAIHTDDIRVIAIAQSTYTEDVSHERRTVSILRKQPVSGGLTITADRTEEVRKTGQYLRDQIEEKIQAMKRRVIVSTGGHDRTKQVSKEVGRNPKLVKQKMERAKIQEADRGIISDKTKDLTDAKSVLSEWWISWTILTFVPLLPVAPSAALYWFTVLRDERTHPTMPEVPPQQVGRLQNKGREGAPFSLRVEDVWKAFVIRLKTSRAPAISHRTLPAHRVAAEQPIRRKNQKKAVMREAPRRQMSTEQARFVSWYEAAKILSGFFGPISTTQEGRFSKDMRVQPISQPDVNGFPMEKHLIPVGRFMFAIMVRWLWVVVPGETRMQKTKGVRGTDVIQQEQYGAPVSSKEPPTEGAPWVLLAIIWYLSMIRESGAPGTHIAPQQKNPRPKRKRKKVTLPESGVIFAFAS